MNFRRATAADIAWILEIEADARAGGYLSGSTREEHEASICNPANEYWIAERDGAAAAELILRSVNSPHQSIELQRIVVVTPDQGIGTEVVRWALDRCFREHGAHRVWLHTFEDNHRAKHLYTRLGFAVDGNLRECVRWTDGTRRSLLVMSILRHEYEHLIRDC
ncbi:MAG TPA: GNAT family N-acetyltransferase [Bryobacteraceae bacterium]|nr:GNAT family N-acetyltransferase [Bryobacteraceae bacterium]